MGGKTGRDVSDGWLDRFWSRTGAGEFGCWSGHAGSRRAGSVRVGSVRVRTIASQSARRTLVKSVYTRLGHGAEGQAKMRGNLQR